jgi:hypothetical protein
MATCQMCGAEISSGEYCGGCADYLRQSNEQGEHEETRRREYEEEMRRDAFGK